MTWLYNNGNTIHIKPWQPKNSFKKITNSILSKLKKLQGNVLAFVCSTFLHCLRPQIEQRTRGKWREIPHIKLTFWLIIKMWFYCSWGGWVAPWVEVKASSMAADESWCLTTRWLASAQKLDWIQSERKPFHGWQCGLTTDPLTPRGQLPTIWCFSVTHSDSKLSAPLTPQHS